MINVIGQCVESGNETGARQLFDVFETLLILVSRSSKLVAFCVVLIQDVRKSLFLANISLNLPISSFGVARIATTIWSCVCSLSMHLAGLCNSEFFRF